MLAPARNQTITVHNGKHMAVHVSTLHMRFADGGTDEQREVAWEMAVESWWNDASEIAQEIGYRGAASEGRSGAWCAPFYQGDSYPDPSDKKEQRRFLRFQTAIEGLMQSFPATYDDCLSEYLAGELEERQESERIVRQFCEAM